MFFSLFLFVAQVNQPELIHALQTGTFPQRQDALKQILQIPLAQRSEQLWLALAQKLENEQALGHQKADAIDAAVRAGSAIVGSSDEREEDEVGWYYLQSLAEAVGQWHDPRALPALVDAASLVDVDVFLQFGGVIQAVPGVR